MICARTLIGANKGGSLSRLCLLRARDEFLLFSSQIVSHSEFLAEVVLGPGKPGYRRSGGPVRNSPAVHLLEMKLTLLALALVLVAIPVSVAQTQDGFPHPSPRLYELYSWPGSSGIWNFCLLPSPSGVNIPVETIFDKQFRITGIGKLERKLSVLPNGTRIIWLPGLTAGQTPNKESSKLALPPSSTVEKVKRYAKQHDIQLEVPSSTPG